VERRAAPVLAGREAVRERPVLLRAARAGAALAPPLLEPPSDAGLAPDLLEADRPLPVVFSAAPEERWLALRLALLEAVLPPDLDRPAEDRDEVEAGLLDPLLLPPLLPLLLPPLLPSTFCAASATASAMSAPSLPTLAAMALAALPALSAASIPASRILRRTEGLALIAAAAAARPAASISLLIAALASLSIASLTEEFAS
jgi:hypothetical protein